MVEKMEDLVGAIPPVSLVVSLHETSYYINMRVVGLDLPHEVFLSKEKPLPQPEIGYGSWSSLGRI
jgi:hypothetical protein